MKKRMTKDERQAIINLVTAKAKEAKETVLEAKLLKDKNYKEWLKLRTEQEELQKKVNELSRKAMTFGNELNRKYECYINFNDGRMNISSSNWQRDQMKQLELHNRLVIMGLEGIDVASLIEELVTDYNK
jgi:hypothetical protein